MLKREVTHPISNTVLIHTVLWTAGDTLSLLVRCWVQLKYDAAWAAAAAGAAAAAVAALSLRDAALFRTDSGEKLVRITGCWAPTKIWAICPPPLYYYTLPGSQASYRHTAKDKIINNSLPGCEKWRCQYG